ncbi:MAG: TSUP family transporter [Chitinophagaceae bacterium]|nr:TSUP family transporter [Chitinophagaceae bacterium]
MRLLIIGGGKVGLEKLHAVIHNSPETRVTVVATEVCEGITAMMNDYPLLTILQEKYHAGHLDLADVVIVAVNDIPLAERIREDAKARNLLVNVADKPELCDFYLGAVVKKGNLKIAISTNGKSPTIAKRLKDTFNETLPAELDEVLTNMQSIRTKLNGNFDDKVKKLNKLTKVLAEKEETGSEQRWRKIATYSLLAFGFMLTGHFIFSYVPFSDLASGTVDFYNTLEPNFGWMVLAGFLAQMVDGATSMGYGVTSAIVLMQANVSPAAISGSIHTAEMFASGASGYSHYKFGNVNKKLFKALLIPGVIGAVLGAVLLVKFGETHISYIRPIMAAYTLFLGIKIFITAFTPITVKKKFKQYGWLAGAGGFLDSFGGGGWGPIVTATLITKGRTPRFVVGSVSLTEFFVTLASAFTFFTLIGVQHWQVILALVIGGLLAAPIAARIQGKLPRKASFILLGTIVVIWSIRILVRAF